MYGGGAFGGYDAGGFGGGGQFGGDQFGGDQFGGGGFVAGGGDQFGGQAYQQGSQGAAGGFNVDNSGPDGKAKNAKEKQSLLPVTIKQLKNAPSAASGEQNFTVDGHELHQVTIVGLIMTAEEQNTNLQYTIDDGTDDIIVKMWVDQESEELMVQRRAEWREGKVVRVVGQLRMFNNSRSIVAYNIQPLADFNEYTFHFIEAVHSHLRLTKGKPPAAAAGGAPLAYGGAGAGAPGGAGGAPPQPALLSVQQQVLEYFKQFGENSEAGCTIAQCHEAMAASGVSLEQIRNEVNQLVSDGHLYSTIDDDHYKGI